MSARAQRENGSIATALRCSLRLMNGPERSGLIFGVVARSAVNLLDLVGLALVGLIVVAAVGADQLAGITVPRLGVDNLLPLALGALTVVVVRSLLAVLFGWLIARRIASAEQRVSSEIMSSLLFGQLNRLAARDRAGSCSLCSPVVARQLLPVC